jgi:hypothetical protein
VNLGLQHIPRHDLSSLGRCAQRRRQRQKLL